MLVIQGMIFLQLTDPTDWTDLTDEVANPNTTARDAKQTSPGLGNIAPSVFLRQAISSTSCLSGPSGPSIAAEIPGCFF